MIFFYSLVVFLVSCHSSLFNESVVQDNAEFLNSVTVRNDRDPVVIVPGLCGSRIESRYRLFGPGTPFSNLWLDVARTLPIASLIFVNDFKTSYNPKKDTFSAASHVETRVVDYGGVEVSTHPISLSLSFFFFFFFFFTLLF
jgi:hypothetical protein